MYQVDISRTVRPIPVTDITVNLIVPHQPQVDAGEARLLYLRLVKCMRARATRPESSSKFRHSDDISDGVMIKPQIVWRDY